MHMSNGKTCKHVTAIYFYSLYGNIDVNHGNYVLINNHGHNILELYNVLIKARLTTSNHD